jgi:enamine deaminase RidA (YjgF/YER057c/UK114 family)
MNKGDSMHSSSRTAFAGILLFAGIATTQAADITRHSNGGTFPIARAVEVPAGKTLSVFGRIKESLDKLGLGFGDVVAMTVYLVGDPAKEGKMDFEGMMAAYSQFFGTKAQPNLPARSTVQVAGLVAPGMLVEIEVQLAK